MKAYIILINWSLSFFGLGMENADGGMLWTVIGFCWFMISTLIVIIAQRKGVLNRIEKRFKIDQL